MVRARVEVGGGGGVVSGVVSGPPLRFCKNQLTTGLGCPAPSTTGRRPPAPLLHSRELRDSAPPPVVQSAGGRPPVPGPVPVRRPGGLLTT